MSSISSNLGRHMPACVTCRRRKIKCDRNSTCSNCAKLGVTCTRKERSLTPRRRESNQDLHDRVTRLEGFLQEYTAAKLPVGSEEPATDDEPYTTHKLPGKLVVEGDGKIQFTDSYLVAHVYSELQVMREILDSHERVGSNLGSPDSQSQDGNSGMLLSEPSGATGSLESLLPQPAQVIPLWQIFVARVNPFTKVVHVPTLEPLLVDVASGNRKLSKNLEALLFSICAASSVSMTDEESVTILGRPRKDAFDRFTSGLRLALIRTRFLQTYDLVTLQSLVLYLISLQGLYDKREAWVLNAVVIRIAQKLGLHRDGEQLGLPPFETEMRRRLWWQIITLDIMYALVSGLNQSLLPRASDTKEPTNINDADLDPSMEAIEPRDGPTDMIFCLLNYEIASLFIRNPGFETVTLRNEMGNSDFISTSAVENYRKQVDILDKSLETILSRYCDPSKGPIHIFSMHFRPIMVSRIREMMCPPNEQPEWGIEVLTPMDNLFRISVTTGEHTIKLYQSMNEQGFLWFMRTYFRIDVFMYMVGQLYHRTDGKLVERAWQQINLIYQYHPELFDVSKRPHMALAAFVLRAWEKRQEVLRTSSGGVPEVPGYIYRLRGSISPQDISPNTSAEAAMAQPNLTQEHGLMTTPDFPLGQMFGSYPGANFMNWDTFLDEAQLMAISGGFDTGTRGTRDG